MIPSNARSKHQAPAAWFTWHVEYTALYNQVHACTCTYSTSIVPSEVLSHYYNGQQSSYTVKRSSFCSVSMQHSPFHLYTHLGHHMHKWAHDNQYTLLLFVHVHRKSVASVLKNQSPDSDKMQMLGWHMIFMWPTSIYTTVHVHCMTLHVQQAGGIAPDYSRIHAPKQNNHLLQLLSSEKILQIIDLETKKLDVAAKYVHTAQSPWQNQSEGVNRVWGPKQQTEIWRKSQPVTRQRHGVKTTDIFVHKI